jgi:hypothetical protein
VSPPVTGSAAKVESAAVTGISVAADSEVSGRGFAGELAA